MDTRTKMVGVVSCVVLMGLVGLSGCAFIKGKSTPHETVSDASITAAVQAKLRNDIRTSYLPPIDVDTERGVVHLGGAMPTEYQRDLATDFAKEVEGVNRVDNDLVILPWR